MTNNAPENQQRMTAKILIAKAAEEGANTNNMQFLSYPIFIHLLLHYYIHILLYYCYIMLKITIIHHYCMNNDEHWSNLSKIPKPKMKANKKQMSWLIVLFQG